MTEDTYWQRTSNSEWIEKLKFRKKVTREMVEALREVALVQAQWWTALDRLERALGRPLQQCHDFRRFVEPKSTSVRYVAERYVQQAVNVSVCDDCDGYLDDDGNCPDCDPVDE